LAAGIAIAAKALRPATRIVAVASDRSLAMLDSLLAGRPVEAPEHPSLADALGGGIGLDNRYSFTAVRDLVDEIEVVSDEEIAEALRFVFDDARLFVEGAAAVSVAALLRAGRREFPGPIVAVMTGDNIEPRKLVEILSEPKSAGPPTSIGETR
jgi:threonine dehydratase